MDECPYVDQVDEFLHLFVRSGLIHRPQLDQLLESYRSEYMPAANTPDTITSVCSFLIGRDVLTCWQCAKLRRGQYKGFFLDQFKLMDVLGVNETNVYYLAVDTREGGFVEIAYTPRIRRKGPEIEYRVERRVD